MELEIPIMFLNPICIGRFLFYSKIKLKKKIMYSAVLINVLKKDNINCVILFLNYA